jgi:hypothetical protein
MPDGTYQTIDKTFFMIQKIKKELRDNNRWSKIPIHTKLDVPA